MKVVVAGPRRSGKSVFTGALLSEIQDRLSPEDFDDVAWTTIDLWDDSLPWVLEEELELPGEGDPDEEDVRQHRGYVEDLDQPLVIADAPGIIDQHTGTLLEPFDVMIILSRTDDGIQDWKDVAGELDIEVVWVLNSVDPDSDEDSEWDPESGYGRFRPCERTTFREQGVRALPHSSQDVLSKMARALLEWSFGD